LAAAAAAAADDDDHHKTDDASVLDSYLSLRRGVGAPSQNYWGPKQDFNSHDTLAHILTHVALPTVSGWPLAHICYSACAKTFHTEGILTLKVVC